MVETVQSADGTTIAFERTGTGPAVILIGGALSTRQGASGLAELLSPHFTVYMWDRRGRGDSSDTRPYSVQREIEDLARRRPERDAPSDAASAPVINALAR